MNSCAPFGRQLAFKLTSQFLDLIKDFDHNNDDDNNNSDDKEDNNINKCVSATGLDKDLGFCQDIKDIYDDDKEEQR